MCVDNFSRMLWFILIRYIAFTWPNPKAEFEYQRKSIGNRRFSRCRRAWWLCKYPYHTHTHTRTGTLRPRYFVCMHSCYGQHIQMDILLAKLPGLAWQVAKTKSQQKICMYINEKQSKIAMGKKRNEQILLKPNQRGRNGGGSGPVLVSKQATQRKKKYWFNWYKLNVLLLQFTYVTKAL